MSVSLTDSDAAALTAHALAYVRPGQRRTVRTIAARQRVEPDGARIVGDRIYIRLLIADEDGEKTMEAFSAADPAPSDSEGAVEPSEEPSARL